MTERGDTPDNGTPARRTRGVFPWLWHSELLRSFGVIAVVILCIKGCVLDQYTVPSSSMYPTLQGDNHFFRDDRILVNKWIYGPRIPFTTVRLWRWGGPKRWDIVVFRSVDKDSQHSILVKRVVGLPGERIQIEEGKIHINGEVVEPPAEIRKDLDYGVALNALWADVMRSFVRFVAEGGELGYFNATSPGVAGLREDFKALRPELRGVDVDALSQKEIEAICKRVHKESLNLILELVNSQNPALKFGVIADEEHSRVPEGHYFFLGDNGPVSLDGRVFGWVPHSHLHGPAIAICWPLRRWRDFSGFSKTWWGKLLLYGIPATLVGLELHHYLIERKRKRAVRA